MYAQYTINIVHMSILCVLFCGIFSEQLIEIIIFSCFSLFQTRNRTRTLCMETNYIQQNKQGNIL